MDIYIYRCVCGKVGSIAGDIVLAICCPSVFLVIVCEENGMIVGAHCDDTFGRSTESRGRNDRGCCSVPKKDGIHSFINQPTNHACYQRKRRFVNNKPKL